MSARPATSRSTAEGGTETLKNHPVGYMLVQPSKIYSTANGTTAADLVLIF
jgi:hypothetical protein